MKDIFQVLAELKVKYPDDIKRIEEEGVAVKALLAGKRFYEDATTKRLISLCRKDILTAKKRLASDISLVGDEKAQRGLWFLIESRQWFLNMVVKNYDAEMASIQNGLENELDA